MPRVYQSTNSYIIDIENGAETARLLVQDQRLTRAMGGLLPEQCNLSGVESVLDIACGPGGWAIDLGFAYPNMDVTGVDINPAMIHYARALARVQHRENVTFTVMDVTQPLAFEAHRFDLVNARFLAGFLDQVSWPKLLSECLRVLQPGGIMRLTECELGISSSPALQHLGQHLCQALFQQQRTFSADGHTIGMTDMLGKLLSQAGFAQIQKRPFLLDSSSREDHSFSAWKEVAITFELLKPYLMRSGVVEEVTFDDLYQRMLLEIIHEEFCCLSFGLTVWAVKPHS